MMADRATQPFIFVIRHADLFLMLSQADFFQLCDTKIDRLVFVEGGLPLICHAMSGETIRRPVWPPELALMAFEDEVVCKGLRSRLSEKVILLSDAAWEKLLNDSAQIITI